jgi:hypothetical protein
VEKRGKLGTVWGTGNQRIKVLNSSRKINLSKLYLRNQ